MCILVSLIDRRMSSFLPSRCHQQVLGSSLRTRDTGECGRRQGQSGQANIRSLLPRIPRDNPMMLQQAAVHCRLDLRTAHPGASVTVAAVSQQAEVREGEVDATTTIVLATLGLLPSLFRFLPQIVQGQLDCRCRTLLSTSACTVRSKQSECGVLHRFLQGGPDWACRGGNRGCAPCGISDGGPTAVSGLLRGGAGAEDQPRPPG